ncbi:MAG: MoxR family ATPase [Candidatus Dadabacteria bacterium]|nr:MAG: MoxR family ATPase [Candidatus Dadabacteria bacterium]
MQQRVRDAEEAIAQVYLGHPRAIRQATLTVLSGGHLLIEDVPGIGKTTLALALARVLDLPFHRIQMTSDMLPADVIGVSVWNPDAREFEFRPGPIFANVLLVDELNRATPRTQSALLEAMAEGRVSSDGRTLDLPQPYVVLATQNPVEQFGTFPLPESQLDRFLMRIQLGYPALDDEIEMLQRKRYGHPVDALPSHLSGDMVLEARAAVDAVTMHPDVAAYIARIVHETRESPEVLAGVSPRGALALSQVARAAAWLDGRDFVTPTDVYDHAISVCAHRLVLAGQEGEHIASRLQEAVMERLLEAVPAPI